jgi:hypothetical protein
MQLSGRCVGLLIDQLTKLIQIDLDHRCPTAWPGTLFAMIASPLHHTTHP